MNFSEALEKLKEGRCVKRHYWDGDAGHIRVLKDDFRLVYCTGIFFRNFDLTDEDMAALDWYVLKE